MYDLTKPLCEQSRGRFYIKQVAGTRLIQECTWRVMNEYPMPNWFNWRDYEVVVK